MTALELWFFSQPKATFHNDQLQGVHNPQRGRKIQKPAETAALQRQNYLDAKRSVVLDGVPEINVVRKIAVPVSDGLQDVLHRLGSSETMVLFWQGNKTYWIGP